MHNSKTIVLDGQLQTKEFEGKPKVFIVGPASPSRGGISLYIDEQLVSPLREYFTLVVYNPLILKNRSKKRGTESQLSFKEIVDGLKVLKTFIMVMRKFDPAIVHIHTTAYWGFYEKSVILLIAKIMFRKKVILHIHSGEFGVFYKNAATKVLVKWVLEKANKTLIVSKKGKEEIGLDKVITVDNCVRFDSKVLSVDKSILREKYGIPKDKTVFLSAALLDKRKGVFETLVAFRDIYKARDGFFFIIAGEGPESSRIISFVESNLLNKNVKVMDFITGQKKEDIFLLSDVFILNSVAEGLSVAQLETLSYGLFLITTPVGAASDAENVFNDDNCIRVPVNDIEALQRAIMSVLDKKIDIETITKKNFFDFKDRFDVQPVFEKIKLIYEDILNTG